jgi:DNA-directed RNA polymerase I subunit RPA1
MENRVGDAGNELSPDTAIIDEHVRSPDPTNTCFSGTEPQIVLRHKFLYKTTHQQELWSKTINEVFASMPKRCSECEHPAQTLKKDGYLRLLQKPVSKRLRGKATPEKAKAASRGSASKSQSKGKEIQDPAGHSITPPTILSSDEEDSDSDESNPADEEDADGDEDHGIIAVKVSERQNAGDQLSELPTNITPQKALQILQLVFETDKDLVGAMYGTRVGSDLVADPAMFFLRKMLVPPNRFRPPVSLGENAFEHPMNANLKSIMTENQYILNLMSSQGKGSQAAKGSQDNALVLDSDALMRHWKSMQNFVNTMIDSAKAEKKVDESVKGVRQELERKEGLMRMHMMGKRVNFACRSVISPDPFMDTDQVGIPEVFAKKLSWAEPVNRWNIRRLRQAVVNGPNVWPGANYIVDERGVKIDLSKKSVQFRLAQAKQLEKVDGRGVNYRVGRHLMDGDYVLVNRQPSLHKCSLMAHRVRVNKNQRVIRIHYANCKSYNADFDGDEINVHFPQVCSRRSAGRDVRLMEALLVRVKLARMAREGESTSGGA